MDSILYQLYQLIKEGTPGEQTVSEVIMLEAFLNAVTFYWQSEHELQIVTAHLIGNKYMPCIRQLIYIMHIECKSFCLI